MSSRQPSGRTSKGFALILGAARAAATQPSNGQSVVQMAERDELVYLALNDAVMAAAIKAHAIPFRDFWLWRGTRRPK